MIAHLRQIKLIDDIKRRKIANVQYVALENWKDSFMFVASGLKKKFARFCVPYMSFQIGSYSYWNDWREYPVLANLGGANTIRHVTNDWHDTVVFWLLRDILMGVNPFASSSPFIRIFRDTPNNWLTTITYISEIMWNWYFP